MRPPSESSRSDQTCSRCASSCSTVVAAARQRGAGRRLHRPRRRLRAVSSAFVLAHARCVVVLFTLLAWPFRLAVARDHAHGAAEGFDRAPDRRRLRRPGSEAHRSVHAARACCRTSAQLARAGSYRRLRTTFPSVSPVAWSSFSTGTHPARHNIFDFLDRDRRTYLPMLSSTRIGKVERFLKLGTYRIPLRSARAAAAAQVEAVLDDPRRAPHLEHGPARADHVPARPASTARELSAMCVPDLLGTQGTFLLFTTRPAGARFKEGGIARRAVASTDDRVDDASSKGPENTFVEGEPAADAAARDRSSIARRGGRTSSSAARASTLAPGAAERLDAR